MLGKLIVLVEEPSMEMALEQLLPRMLAGADFQIIRFQCKDDLLKNLPDRLRGYSQWLPADWAILVLVDQDDDDCRALKQAMERVAANARLMSKTRAGHGQRFQVANRIAVEELEAWFFGDWLAVQAAYPRVSATQMSKQGFRDPDALPITPGSKRTQASTNVMAATSPPASTKSPRLTSSSPCASITR